MRVASLREVSRDELEILLLKIDQSADVTHPFAAPVATSQVIELTERVRPDEKVRAFSKSTPATAANTLPFEFVLRREEVIEEMARAEVVAPIKVAAVAERFVAKAFVEVAAVVVERVMVEPVTVSVPMVAFVAVRLVTVLLVANALVEVALVDVELPVVSAVMVELAETIMPTVVVGARYPFTSDQSLNAVMVPGVA